jgi:hypothetical protein
VTDSEGHTLAPGSRVAGRGSAHLRYATVTLHGRHDDVAGLRSDHALRRAADDAELGQDRITS